jgi:hypothetical protein
MRMENWDWAGATTPRILGRPPSAMASRVRFTGFAQTGDAVSGLPLAAVLENLDPFKPFHDIALGSGGGGSAQASML